MTIALIALAAANCALLVVLVLRREPLADLLATPQGRGAFGELALDRLLADFLGEFAEMYETQYVFDDGERADAAIFLTPDRSQVLAVDAKFPLAHAGDERLFARDVRDRAREIASKYVRPPRTPDFAFMFVPSEAVYYLLLRDRALHEELLRMRVVPTSPNSFTAYLQVLALAFRGRKIERRTAELQRAMVQVAKDFERFVGDWQRVGEKLRQAAKAFEETEKDVDRFARRVAGLEIGEVTNPR